MAENQEPNVIYDGPPQPLNIIIAGAGIGGLTAAIYLRKQGHKVVVLEQSRFANEVGAAVHLAPNCNGIMQRIGINAEDCGANELRRFTNLTSKGALVGSRESTTQKDMWQHKYLLVHRGRLHEALKLKATAQNWPGVPVHLRTSSRVVDADPSFGTVTLENGEVVQGDVIIGADGVHSKMRGKVPPGNITPRSSGKSAFRFMLPKSALSEVPGMAKYTKHDGELVMWLGSTKRMVMYPCNNNSTLNFVAIHPAEATDARTGEYNDQGSKKILLKVFEDFDPELLELISKVNEDTLKLWSLLDMDPLPTWIAGKLALLGDAAHPYTPHQGQGAGQAMEDGAAIAVVLPLGTQPHEVPERLRLFEQFRYERATTIQAFSIKAGDDIIGISEEERKNATLYHLAHDEWDSALHKFRKWVWAQKKNLYWRMPVSFGPMPGPRRDFYGSSRNASNSTMTTMSIKFKTSRTLLDGLLPNDQFSFVSPGTVAYATFSQMKLDKLDWLGGGGYNIFQLSLHGVQYRSKSGELFRGTLVPLLFEDLADPILSGREELGFPKVFCNINVFRRTSSVRAQLSWQGAVFGIMSVEDLQEIPSQKGVGHENGQSNGELTPEATMTWRVIPQVGEQSHSESAYCTITPFRKPEPTSRPPRVWKAARANISFDPLTWDALPTTHHIVSRLAEIPIFEIVESTLTQSMGIPTLDNTKRVD